MMALLNHGHCFNLIIVGVPAERGDDELRQNAADAYQKTVVVLRIIPAVFSRGIRLTGSSAAVEERQQAAHRLRRRCESARPGRP